MNQLSSAIINTYILYVCHHNFKIFKVKFENNLSDNIIETMVNSYKCVLEIWKSIENIQGGLENTYKYLNLYDSYLESWKNWEIVKYKIMFVLENLSDNFLRTHLKFFLITLWSILNQRVALSYIIDCLIELNKYIIVFIVFTLFSSAKLNLCLIAQS